MDTQMSTSKQERIKFGLIQFTEGKSANLVAEEINKEFGTQFTAMSPVVKEARRVYLSKLEVPDKEYYMKESLDDYERIKHRADNVQDLKEGLKIQLASIRDRNELLGLSKAGVNIEINFESKNLSDTEFLDAMNVEVIDVVKEDTELERFSDSTDQEQSE